MMTIHEQFQSHFGLTPAVIARAPGRVEFIGNHTDYNGGAVLGAAIDRWITVAAATNRTNRIRLRRTDGQQPLDFDIAPAGRLAGEETWANYPVGVWHALGDFSLPRPEGFDLLVDSNLPPGAGLSSSAALELATALALLKLAGANLTPDRLALVGRHAENKYVGVPCGILDQGTSAFGAAGHLVHIDCHGPVFSRVPMPPGSHLWIFNTHEKHALIDGLYAKRHEECMAAAKALGVKELAELTPDQFAPLAGQLDPLISKRARHVVNEHGRVGETVAALRRGDISTVGRLLTASHRSSQHLFQNSTPALDRLVDLLVGHPAVFGARLTGGGFGGAVMALTSSEFGPADADAIGMQSGSCPDILHLQVAGGAHVIG